MNAGIKKICRFGWGTLRRHLVPGTRHCVLLAADSRYYDPCRIALNSFLHHNPGWTPVVVDVGFTEDQRRAILDDGVLLRSEPRGQHAKWVAGHARLRVLMDLLISQQFDLLAILECDTATLGAVDASGDVSRFMQSRQFYGVVAGDNWGFVVFKPWLRAIRVFRDVCGTIHDLDNTFVMLEESAATVAMWYHKQTPYRLDAATNCFLPWQRDRLQEIGRRGMRLEGGGPVAVLHYSGDVLNHALTHGEAGLDPRYVAPVRVWHEYRRLVRERDAFLQPREFADFVGPSSGS